MAFLQKRFFYQTNFKPASIKQSDCQSFQTGRLSNRETPHKAQAGFISVLLLAWTTLMMTGIIGFSLLSIGIKNITTVQSHCIQINLKGQKELGLVLNKIINLNDKVLFLHKTRKALSTSLMMAKASGMVPLIPLLKKKLEVVKQMQKAVIMRQKYLLAKSSLIKRRTFKQMRKILEKLNVSHIHEESFYKKALAIKRQKKGDKAYTYKPIPDFINHQKSRFSWTIQLFSPLDKNGKMPFQSKHKPSSRYSCTASLKQKGGTWTSVLYH